MSKHLKPLRGTKQQAIDNKLILQEGEIFFEIPDEGIGAGEGKIKMGDGKTGYEDLPYYVEENTWRDVEDNLTSVSKVNSLSANQGRILKESIDNISTPPIATSSNNGLMSRSMVSKLNGIAEGATKVIVDSELSDSSTNPVQNKLVVAGITGMSNSLTNIFNDALQGLKYIYNAGKSDYGISSTGGTGSGNSSISSDHFTLNALNGGKTGMIQFTKPFDFRQSSRLLYNISEYNSGDINQLRVYLGSSAGSNDLYSFDIPLKTGINGFDLPDSVKLRSETYVTFYCYIANGNTGIVKFNQVYVDSLFQSYFDKKNKTEDFYFMKYYDYLQDPSKNLFVKSTNINDKIESNGRGFTRTTDEPALLIKIRYDNASTGNYWTGFGILAKTKYGCITGTPGNAYSNIHTTDIAVETTPNGNTVYVSHMASAWTNANYPCIVTTSDGKSTSISEPIYYIGTRDNKDKLNKFILAVADYLLFDGNSDISVNTSISSYSDEVQTLTTPANNVLRVFSSGTTEASIVYTSKEGDTAHSWVVGTGVGGENNFGWWDGKSASTKMYLTRDGDLHLGKELYLNKGNAIKDYTGTSNLVYHDNGSQWFGNRVRDTYISTKSTQGIIVSKNDANGNAVQARVLDGLNYSSYALPLSGGTITGAIKTSGNGILNTSTVGSTNFSGGTNLSNGATLILRGKDQNGTDSNGRFEIRAITSKTSSVLVGSPGGALDWSGTKICCKMLQLENANTITTDANNAYGLKFTYFTNPILQIMPNKDNVTNLGHSSYRFAEFRCNNIYISSGTAVTSDRRYKDDIGELDEELSYKFIMALVPSSFKYKDGESGRIHYGLIAQDVEKVLASLGLSNKDFGGIVIEKLTKEVEVETVNDDGETVVEKHLEETGEIKYDLRYEEFIAPLIKTVQMQQKTIENLEERLSKLENKLSGNN